MPDDDPIKRLREILDVVAGLKMPAVIRRGHGEVSGERMALSARDKISQLESYLLLTAEGRQMALQAQLAASDALFEDDREWDDLEGWETFLSGSTAKATGPQIEAAKRRVNPELHTRRRRLDWLVKRFGEQVRRLEQDDEVASRVYTLITG